MDQKPLAPTIFVVDDDPDVLVSLRFLLETEGFPVKTFASGPALLSSSPPGPNDCLVIDYRMTGMNGLELVRHLRARHIPAPVIFVTGDPNEDLTARAAALGVHHVVLKPHIEDSLTAHLRAAIGEEMTGQGKLR